ncbi:MAG: hypothetical protein EAY70_12245 [Sphingomonadales bacterium]|nr:MAG: hypothetical protein EAY70_12245 [Sphingomonadales bacterium]
MRSGARDRQIEVCSRMGREKWLPRLSILGWFHSSPAYAPGVLRTSQADSGQLPANPVLQNIGAARMSSLTFIDPGSVVYVRQFIRQFKRLLTPRTAMRLSGMLEAAAHERKWVGS